MRSSGLRRLLHYVDEAVFPSSLYCMCCGSMIDESRSYSLCDDCIRKFHWITGPTCDLCGKALPERTKTCDALCRPRLCYDCLQSMPAYSKGFSCVTYGLHERELMMDLKYAGRGYIARHCGDMMFDRIEVEIADGIFSTGQHPIDIIVPVPISPERYSERGYNQSALMASRLAARWRQFVRMGPALKAPVVYEELLYRTKATRKLRGLNPAERELELKGAFKVKPAYSKKLHGKAALLIDDIQTTRSTANACSHALLDGGASEVFFLAWASGGNRRPG